MLTHALDHDPSAVRTIVLAEFAKREEDKEAGLEGGTTLVIEIIKLLVGNGETKTSAGVGNGVVDGGEKVTGLKSQLADALKQLLDTGEPEAVSLSSPDAFLILCPTKLTLPSSSFPTDLHSRTSEGRTRRRSLPHLLLRERRRRPDEAALRSSRLQDAQG